MLKNAKLYQKELERLEQLYRYEDEYKYIANSPRFNEYSKWVDDENVAAFVSVNDEDTILGFIGAGIDWVSKNCYGILACSYIHCATFAKDLTDFISMMFNQFGLNRVSWDCYADNPALDGYKKLIDRAGGKQVGYYTEERMLNDGKLHDTVVFEILRKNFLEATNKSK